MLTAYDSQAGVDLRGQPGHTPLFRNSGASPYFYRDKASDCVWALFFVKGVYAPPPPMKIPGFSSDKFN